MIKISFCTTCKGRLWQLRQTLPFNILKTRITVDIVILDYHSDDDLEGYIKSGFPHQLMSGQIKYYKLMTPMVGFDMALAKHIAHTLATGEILFNLDADNFIGDTCAELEVLPSSHLLVPKYVPYSATSRCGRIGLHKKAYEAIGGYDISLRGMGGDDGDLRTRAHYAGLQLTYSEDLSLPIQQCDTHKAKNSPDLQSVVPTQVTVIDYQGVVVTVPLQTT